MRKKMTIPETPAIGNKAPKRLEQKLSIPEAVQLAQKAQRARDLPAAKSIYKAILKHFPDHPDALHFLGIVHHAQGEIPQAIELVEKSLHFAPEVAMFWNNYGNMLLQKDRLDEAFTAFQRCINIDPDFADAHNNLGVLLRARKQPELAEASYLRAIELRPEFVDALTNMANLKLVQGKLPEAIEYGLRVFTLRPENDTSRRMLAYAYAQLGEIDKARKVFAEWLEMEPDNPIAEHHFLALGVSTPPPRASDAYVVSVFNSFATSFDSKLSLLRYKAPELIGEMSMRILEPASASMDILDAGCGTGLCGPLLRSHARHLTGVDLSPMMLEQARERGGYDALHEHELTAFIGQHPDAYDLIVSADTLCYFGDLGDVAQFAAKSLRKRGLLIFTVEESIAKPDQYELFLHGRYGHGEPYVRRILETAGLIVEQLDRETLRLEVGKPVAGLVVAARKVA
jgi:predicted TPR repeat methyltransferase